LEKQSEQSEKVYARWGIKGEELGHALDDGDAR
jgi:hypothetical protein